MRLHIQLHKTHLSFPYNFTKIVIFFQSCNEFEIFISGKMEQYMAFHEYVSLGRELRTDTNPVKTNTTRYFCRCPHERPVLNRYWDATRTWGNVVVATSSPNVPARANGRQINFHKWISSMNIDLASFHIYIFVYFHITKVWLVIMDIHATTCYI